MGTILNEFGELVDNTTNESINKNKKKFEYLDYINEHIRNVNKAYGYLFLPLLDIEIISDVLDEREFKNAILNVQKYIVDHDATKFSDEEFEAYRANFYPTDYEKTLDDNYQMMVKQEFEEAWRHHYENNRHHTLYWLNKETNTINDMDLEGIIEMICDWEAMSIKFNSKTVDWYNNKADKEKSQMSIKTKQIVEEILFNILKLES